MVITTHAVRDITFLYHAPPGWAQLGVIKIDYDSLQSVLKHNSGILKQNPLHSHPRRSLAPISKQASSHEGSMHHKLSKL